MKKEKRESIVRTYEGEKRENKMVYNLIIHRESTVFPNVEKHCRYLLMLIKFESYDMGVFL
jgi:hypothetical protein